MGVVLLAVGLAFVTDGAPAGYPDDTFSSPPIDRRPVFETMAGCSLQGSIGWRADHFHENELLLVRDGGKARTRWRFRSKDARQGTLVLREWIRRPPESIELTIENRSARPVHLRLEVHEMSWQSGRANQGLAWRIGESRAVPTGAAQLCRFSFDEATWPDRPAPDRPRYPIGTVLLHIDGVEPETPYELLLSDLTLRFRPAAGMQLDRLDVPAKIQAGEPAVFEIHARGTERAGIVDVEFRREPRVLWRIRLTPAEIDALNAGASRIERTVPWYLPAGDFTVGLVADGLRVAANGERSVRVENGASPALPLAEQRMHNGRPSLFVDGQPRVWQGYASYDYVPGSVTEFGRSGATVLCVPTCAGMHVHHPVALPTWPAEDRFDYAELDERVCLSLAANPQAMIVLRVSLALPPFWLQEHEESLVRVKDGDRLLIWEETGTRVASLASAAWRRDQERALRALIQHCKHQPWAKQVVGVWLTGEVTEEWFAWGCNDGAYADYSRPTQEAFAQWLGNAGAAPEGIPSPEERDIADRDLYPDTPAGRRAAAYHRFYSELTAETILHFARVVKNETEGRSLVGAFYGYVVQLAGESRQATSGNFALRMLLDDPSLDLLAGIPLHDFRTLADGYSTYISATESILAAGKLYCNENDLFSWLHPGIWYTEYDPADPRAAAMAMHQRECANDAVHGAMAQKFSLMASWHHDAGLHAEFARQKNVYTRAMDTDRTPAEEIAFLVDDTSFAWTPPQSKYLHSAVKLLLYHLGRTGAPVGVWLLSDCDRLPERIKFVVVAYAPAAEPTDIQKLKAVIDQGGRTILVVGPAGLVNPRKPGWDASAVSELLGFPITVDDEAKPGTMTIGDGSAIPSVERLWPRARMDGPGVLRYTDGPTAGAERSLANGGRLIWCGAPPLSGELLGRWAEEAGVHRYAPRGFFVHAARGLVSVTAPASGEATLHFCSPVSVTDLFDGWQGEGRAITCPFTTGQTRLLLTRSARP